MPILRDTGATLDLICKKYVKPSMFINETVCIRTPLEETAVCLPMAEVELDCVFGHVITKAAVLRDSLDQGKYFLRNKTAALFEEVKKNKEIQVYMVNAVETRSQKKLIKERVTKTKDARFKTFYWPKCFSDVEDFVKTCDKCQRVGKPQDKKKAPLKIVPVITEIFTKINIDASGPLPMTPSGNKYIITALCMSSRYPDAIPVANLCSTTVVNLLLQIFSRMGFSRELQTDQGTSFMSALTTEFLERFGVKVVRSSIYHPQSNPVEIMHRTLKRILRVLCLEAIPDWEKILPQAFFALRTVIHDSTGFSPAELVHGKNLRTPVMLLYEKLTEEEHVESSVVDYVFELINRMKRCQELAILHMEDAKQKQKLWYDRWTVKRQFQLGKLVLVIAPSRPNKLSVQWVGPGEIVQ
ncbi:retrovirus-related Pol polyprotein from transposon 412 [Trichonephila clavipes]|nr:retrovirus-related Pol polyprotein from transposon 412 [Trichonephila clavipes]